MSSPSKNEPIERFDTGSGVDTESVFDRSELLGQLAFNQWTFNDGPTTVVDTGSEYALDDNDHTGNGPALDDNDHDGGPPPGDGPALDNNDDHDGSPDAVDPDDDMWESDPIRVDPMDASPQDRRGQDSTATKEENKENLQEARFITRLRDNHTSHMNSYEDTTKKK